MNFPNLWSQVMMKKLELKKNLIDFYLESTLSDYTNTGTLVSFYS